jgi:hypothetical protein
MTYSEKYLPRLEYLKKRRAFLPSFKLVFFAEISLKTADFGQVYKG